MYAYVKGKPISRVDPRGLQEVDIPGYEKPDNAREAAGFLDGEFERVSVSWFCPRSSSQCRIDDVRKATDFIPTASSLEESPSGCTCLSAVWRRVDDNKTLDSNDAVAIANAAAEAAREGPSMWQRLINAIAGAVHH